MEKLDKPFQSRGDVESPTGNKTMRLRKLSCELPAEVKSLPTPSSDSADGRSQLGLTPITKNRELLQNFLIFDSQVNVPAADEFYRKLYKMKLKKYTDLILEKLIGAYISNQQILYLRTGQEFQCKRCFLDAIKIFTENGYKIEQQGTDSWTIKLPYDLYD